jgi:hypothetical protein
LELNSPFEWLASGGALLVPTRRLAFHLRTLYDDAAVQAGQSTWRTPQILTWDELVETQFRRARQAAPEPRHWLPRRASRLV